MVLSLGAALYEGRSAGHKSDLLGPSGVAAPEDGRTPDASNRAIPRGPVIRGQIMKKERNHSASEKTAFTRLELVMVLATTGLLAGLALPLLGSTKSRSDQVSCLSNLRQIGHAFHLWANEHGDKNPWWTAIRDGGSYVSPGEILPPGWAPARNNAYFQMAFISNELRTPKILVCPADPRKAIADTFTDFYNGPTYKNNAVSYFIGLHSFFAGKLAFRPVRRPAAPGPPARRLLRLPARLDRAVGAVGAALRPGHLVVQETRAWHQGVTWFSQLPRWDSFSSRSLAPA